MRILAVFCLVLACLCIRPVSALIVFDGKVVPAWPGEAGQAQGTLGKTSAAAAHYYPHPSGAIWGLTLLVDFPDQAPAFTPVEVDAWLNQKGFNRFGCKGSVRDYYADVSNGKVDFRNEVHGYYRAKNPKSYYEGGSGYQRAGELVSEMMDHFDPEVDFSKFDNDGDGKVEAVSIVYAGSGVTFAQGLWPHAGGLDQKRDGVKLTRYMMTDLGKTLSLYVFCHECGHMIFGWPDLYGVGDYCLMANRPNDVNPVIVNDFYRADQGWIDVVDIDKNMNAYYRAGANSAVGYRFANPARPQECFFWSNLKNEGRRAVLKGRGMLVLHFDKDIGVNDPPKVLSLSVVQADGKRELDAAKWPSPGSDPRDYFSLTGGASFGSASTPAAKWNNGAASGLNLHDIGPAADTIGFYVGTGAVLVRPRDPAALAWKGFHPAALFDAKGVRLPENRPGTRPAYGKGLAGALLP
ncbi:MAG TPA: M6 family metalloprotease domain-containing protein [Fibrobacteria bacterium]|nr:M6 family metalloprotease domain-containing protein [Fibrobacteria bacterium]